MFKLILMHLRSNRSREFETGFTLIELLVVIGIIAILAGLLLPSLSKAKEGGRSAVCKNNVRQITLGMMMYVDENGDYFPWCGDVDRNRAPDWMFGGQPSTDTAVQARWKSVNYGFHAESGSVFSYVTGQPRVSPHRDNYTNRFDVYRCPSTGAIGRALRVTYSMSGRFDAGDRSPRGIRSTGVVNPSGKFLLANEDPKTMHNAAFHPGLGASAVKGSMTFHNGRANFGFADGHSESLKNKLVIDILSGRSGLDRVYFDLTYGQ
ncbi:MAG: DUF1559 domain-containing protein [Pedosphaera sp.]|nr:DUF1559 domain-containing protein [Pedosphaera sp.]